MAWEFKIAITAIVALVACYLIDINFRRELPPRVYALVPWIGTGSAIAIPTSLLVALWRLT